MLQFRCGYTLSLPKLHAMLAHIQRRFSRMLDTIDAHWRKERLAMTGASQLAQQLNDGPLAWEKTAEGRLYSALSTVSSHREVVQLFREVLQLESTAIARGAGVDPSSVSRWLSDDVDIRRPGRLGEVRAAIMALLKSRRMTVGTLRYWLTTSPDVLLGEEPLAALGHGRYEDVVDAGRFLTDPLGPATRAEFEERKREVLRGRTRPPH